MPVRWFPLLRQLAALERKHRLVHASGRLYRFDHHQVQETLYDDVSELLREEYHSVLGDLLEQRDADPIELATHFLKGNQPERAKPHAPPRHQLAKPPHRQVLAARIAHQVPGQHDNVGLDP